MGSRPTDIENLEIGCSSSRFRSTRQAEALLAKMKPIQKYLIDKILAEPTKKKPIRERVTFPEQDAGMQARPVSLKSN
jgi:hypothetical protein